MFYRKRRGEKIKRQVKYNRISMKMMVDRKKIEKFESKIKKENMIYVYINEDKDLKTIE